MGRSFDSVRMGATEVSARWLKASRAMKEEDQIYGQKVAEMAKMHSGEVSTPLTILRMLQYFSVLVELMRDLESK